MVAWVAIGAGGVAAAAGFAQTAPGTVEIASVPLAIALLSTGWLHLDVTPTARSWPWLAPGLLVLLVHTVAQLWPWISLAYDALPWWLWLGVGVGVGGVILIVLAARCEQRITIFKAIAVNISALR